jgi:hypothetical protein
MYDGSSLNLVGLSVLAVVLIAIAVWRMKS